MTNNLTYRWTDDMCMLIDGLSHETLEPDSPEHEFQKNLVDAVNKFQKSKKLNEFK